MVSDNKEAINLTNNLSNLVKENKVFIVPSSLFEYLQLKIEDKKYDNVIFVNNVCMIIEYILSNNKVQSSEHMKSIHREYKEVIQFFGNRGDLYLHDKVHKKILRGDDGIELRDEKGNIKFVLTGTNIYKFNNINWSLIWFNDGSEIEMEKNYNITLFENHQKCLDECSIDIDGAIFAEYNNHIKDGSDTSIFAARVAKIFRFLYKRSVKKGDNVDRIYSSFTSLTSVSRPFVKLNGKYFNMADMKNAQPVFSCKYLTKAGYDIDDNFIYDTSKGKFYEAIIQHSKVMKFTHNKRWEVDEKTEAKRFIKTPFYIWDTIKQVMVENRDNMKEEIYCCIFFGQQRNTQIWKIFKDLYPKTANAIISETKLTNDKLAKTLQNKEAEIFHSLNLSNAFFVVHDAIYFIDKFDQSTIVNHLDEHLGKGKYKLDVKDYTPKQDINVSIDYVAGFNMFIVESSRKRNSNNQTKDLIINYWITNDGIKYKDIVMLMDKEHNIQVKQDNVRKTINRFINSINH
jgi:hypothetical protein